MGLTTAASAVRTMHSSVPTLPSVAAVFVAAGVTGAIALAAIGEPTATEWSPFFPLIGSLGILIGVLRNRPIATGAWLSIAVGLFLFWMGSAASAGQAISGEAALGIGDLAYTAGYPLLLGGAVRLVVGTRRGDWTVYADGAIVGIAGAMLLLVLVDPGGQMHLLPQAAQVVVVADVAMVAMLLPLPLVRETRSASSVLLVLGFTFLATADARYALLLFAGGPSGDLQVIDWLGGIGWLCGFVLLGAAGLHPSASSLGARSANPAGLRDPVRLGAVSLALMVVPVMMLVGEAAHDGLLTLSLASVAITALVIVRMRRTFFELAKADLRFRRFMDASGILAFIKDHEGRYTYMNERAIAAGGLAHKDWYGRTDPELFPPDVADAYRASDEVAKSEGLHVSTTEHGGRTWHSEKFRIPGNGGSVGLLVTDITERVQMDERIRMLDAAIGEARDGVAITDREHRIVYVNPAFERISGVAASDLLGRLPAERFGRSRSGFAWALGHVVKHGRPWMGDVVDRHADGTSVTSATTISPLHGADGEVIGHLAIKRDVTRKRAEEAAFERRARERALVAETLASLRAGRSAEETADEICRQVGKVPEIAMVTIMACDPDGIATIIGQSNRLDTQQTGLSLSRERSDYLRGRAVAGPWVERWLDPPGHPYGPMIRELGITAHAYAPLRIGDEPLGILIAGSDADDAHSQLAERLPALLEFAAIAGTLLIAPLEARNAAARSQRAIRDAVEAHAFRTVFQPIAELHGGSIRGYEALTRFDDGRAPDVWFDEARELGLGLELEIACLWSAISASLTLPDEAWLNLNVSPELVMSGRLQGLLPHLPRQLVLEITEHAAITDYAAFRGAVMLLDGRVRIAVDDAGAGFASLRHIVELGPWLVKLDRSLVSGIDADPARQAVVAGMVHFAEAAGLVLVGEGIETMAELETLRSLGISLGQGFLIGHPEPVSAAEAAADGYPARVAAA